MADPFADVPDEEIPADADPFADVPDEPVSVPASPTAKPRLKTTAAQAAGLGALNSATFGFNDEIGGGVNALMQWAGLVPEIPRSRFRGDMTGADTSGYTAERNRQRQLEAAAKAEHGGSYMAGQIGTGLAMSGGGGGGALRTVGRLAAEGAAQGVGESEAEGVEGVAKDAAEGAATTLATAGALKVGGKTLEAIGNTAPAREAKARLRRLFAAGIDPRNKKQMGAHTADEQAEYMKREGIGKGRMGGLLPASTAEIQEQAAAAGQKAGKAREALVKELGDVPVQAGEVGNRLRLERQLEAPPTGRAIVDKRAWPKTPKQVVPEAKRPPLTPGQQAVGEKSTVPDTRPAQVPGAAPRELQAAPGTVPALKRRALVDDTVPDPKPYHYHATPEGNVSQIRKEGLKPREGGKNYALKKNKNKIYMASEGQADHWAKNLEDVSGQPSARLRSKRTVQDVPGANKDLKVREQTIPPEDLEIRNTAGEWGPLVPNTAPATALTDTVLDVSKTVPDRAPRMTAFADTAPPPPKPTLPPTEPVKDPRWVPKETEYRARERYFNSLGQQPLREMDRLRSKASDAAADHVEGQRHVADIAQTEHRAINDVMERAAGPKGPQLRQAGRDQAMAIRAEEGAGRLLAGEAKSAISPMEGAAVMMGGPKGAALVGARRAMKGRGMSAAAGLTELDAAGRRKVGAIGRALEPRARQIGGAVGRSVLNVQRAAEESPEEAAKAHFLESSSNPEYRKFAHETE